MTDQELLEFAAKAADVFLTPKKLAEVFPGWDWCETDAPYFKECGSMVGTVVWYGSDGVELGGTEKLEWDPLNDDGDALRLAVKLDMHIMSISGGGHEFVNVVGYGPGPEDFHDIYEDHHGDPCQAMRRAIVLAAAAIGKDLP